LKIVLVSMNFSPELTGIGKYSGEMAEGLVARGHEVSVVCAPPYYPAWQLSDGYSGREFVTEQPMPGLTVYRCPVWIPKRLGGLTRMLHLASFALSSAWMTLKLVGWQPQVVFVVAPAFFCAPAVWLAARLSGAKAWLHVQDFEVDAAFELGMLKQPLLRRTAKVLEALILRRFDVVSTISNRMQRLLGSKGVASSKTEMLANWIDVSGIQPTPDSAVLRQSLSIADGQLVCLFSGTLNRKPGLEVLIEAARRLAHDPRFVFVICGNGEMREPLESMAQGLGNVRFMNLLPAARVNGLLNMADIHLLPQLRGAADLVMPSKLVGMLASGRPVIAAGLPGSEMAHVVTGCGLVIEPEDAEVLSQAIVNMANDPQWRDRLGAAGRLYAERTFDSKAIFNRLDNALVLLVDPHHAQAGVLAAARAASDAVISAATDGVSVPASGADTAQ
jgi:colanic acid biosynthesis glycosyl transferase WcaI